MRKSLIAILSGLFLISCSPLSYTISVEKRVDSPSEIDFQGEIPGIITLSERVCADSINIAQIGIGMARAFEEQLSLTSGSVPVYFFYSDELDLSSPQSREFLHRYTGTDMIFLADSLIIEECQVSYPAEKGYYDGRFMPQTAVYLPYKVDLSLIRRDSTEQDNHISIDENYSWVLISETPLSKEKASEKVFPYLSETFIQIGEKIAERFLPKWETIERRIYLFNDDKWTQAYLHAYNFEWERAMEIWMEEAKSNNTKRAGYAAYNISVACEILELEQLGQHWKEQADKLLNF